MHKAILIDMFLAVMVCFLLGCEGDCKDEQIEKVEWVTTYTDKTKDTLPAYSIIENKREYIELYKEVKHTVTIRNDNALYSGMISLSINYGYYNYGEETRTKEFEYVSIAPNKSYTFTYYSQAGKYANYNSSYTILQKPVSFTYKERKDEIKTETILVNNCEENIEALRVKYKTIKNLYSIKIKTVKNNGQE